MDLDSPWALLRGVTWAAGLGAGTPAPALRWEGAESRQLGGVGGTRQLLLQTGAEGTTGPGAGAADTATLLPSP